VLSVQHMYAMSTDTIFSKTSNGYVVPTKRIKDRLKITFFFEKYVHYSVGLFKTQLKLVGRSFTCVIWG
jgi:hypothetical protein